MTAHPTTLIRSDQTFESIGRSIEQAAFGRVGRAWWLAMAASVGLVGLLVISVGWLFVEGVGVWDNNIPVTWALDIVGYDWWIGVATGSLLLSVLPLLLEQEWRGGIARVAETVAVLAAAAAGATSCGGARSARSPARTRRRSTTRTSSCCSATSPSAAAHPRRAGGF